MLLRSCAVAGDGLHVDTTVYVFELVCVMCDVPQVGERIRVILDCDDNTLAFEKNYEFLGNDSVFLWHVT